MGNFAPMEHQVKISGEDLVLHPAGAMFWMSRQMLLLSDLHLGKITHFRKYGAAVPPGATKRNFERLQQLVDTYAPRQISFLGDLFHSHMNREWELFRLWATSCSAALELVVGNHDVIDPTRYEALGIRLHDTLQCGPFLLTHHPLENLQGASAGRFNIAGHIHPAVRLAGPGRQALRLPCFYLRKNQMILPAFGEFTGTYTLEPAPGDRVFALAEGSIIALDYPPGQAPG